MAVRLALTPKERAMVAHYVQIGNAVKAAIAAGYAPKSAEKNASTILKRPHVAAFLAQQVQAKFEEEAMGQAEIRARLARIARFDPRKLANEDGTFKSLNELDAETAEGLRGFETELIFRETADGNDAIPLATRKYKFADKLQALRTLAQIEQMLTPEQAHVNIFIDMDARMDQARKRHQEKLEREEKVVSDQ
jgi:phage terminase small subunit